MEKEKKDVQKNTLLAEKWASDDYLYELFGIAKTPAAPKTLRDTMIKLEVPGVKLGKTWLYRADILNDRMKKLSFVPQK